MQFTIPATRYTRKIVGYIGRAGFSLVITEANVTADSFFWSLTWLPKIGHFSVLRFGH